MKPKVCFLISVHTDAGKTISAAVLCKALGAAYWKPLQTGIASGMPTDTDKVKSLVPGITTFPEIYRLADPSSPHQAAALEGVTLNDSTWTIPPTDSPLIIEIAGGLMSPITANKTYLDWILQTGLPVLFVIPYYLGSINHSLMTLQVLQQHNVPVIGVVFNGKENPYTRSFIEPRCPYPVWGEIPLLDDCSPETIAAAASAFTHHQWETI
jgi:dethiobiotin synthetase